MDKIPEDAESLTVLVGGVKFLNEPVVAFVRLAQVGKRFFSHMSLKCGGKILSWFLCLENCFSG